MFEQTSFSGGDLGSFSSSSVTRGSWQVKQAGASSAVVELHIESTDNEALSGVLELSFAFDAQQLSVNGAIASVSEGTANCADGEHNGSEGEANAQLQEALHGYVFEWYSTFCAGDQEILVGDLIAFCGNQFMMIEVIGEGEDQFVAQLAGTWSGRFSEQNEIILTLHKTWMEPQGDMSDFEIVLSSDADGNLLANGSLVSASQEYGLCE